MGCSQSNTHGNFQYSIPVTSLESAVGESQVYRHPLAVKELAHTIKADPSVLSVHDAYVRSFKKFPNNNYMGTRETLPDGKFGPYKWKTYAQVQDISTKLGSGMINLQFAAPGSAGQPEGSFVVIWSKNRAEWIETDIACALYKLALVPVYDTLGPEAIHYIFSQTRARTIFLSNDHLDALLQEAGKFETLQNVVVFEPFTEEQRTKAEWAGLKLFTSADVIKNGEGQKHEYIRAGPEDCYTVNYTSGTTGLPKGVLIAQSNILAAVAGVDHRDDIDITEKDVYLSYLPLAHTLERTACLYLCTRGASFGFFNGDVQRLKEDLEALRPTFFISVPRLFGRFYDKMQEGLGKLTGFKKSLADKAVHTKLENLNKEGKLNHGLYDSLVFKKMKEALGGRVRLMLSGSAPIEPEVQNFFRVAIGVPFVEGYGQTETCASSFISQTNVPSFGHVGGPLPCLEMKVVDVPEMNYTSKDRNAFGVLAPRGEVCLRGPPVFKGYYKDPERTAEALDKDGWVHTGDVGRINPDGSLSIVDRKKNIFKLAQGEYVASEKVENCYLTSKYVTEVFLYGDSLKSYCVAIAVPDKDALLALGRELGLHNLTFEQLCQNKEVIAAVLGDLNKRGKEHKINSFELAKQLYLEPVSFGEKKLLTPTFKLVRHDAKEHYIKTIEQLYALPLAETRK